MNYTTLEPHDLLWMTRLLPKPVKDIMKQYGADIVCAGGFVRSCVLNEQPNDIDLFCPNPTLAKALAFQLAAGEKIVETPNAFTIPKNKNIRFTTQFIHRWTYPTPYELLESFDFTVACAAFWYDTTLPGWKSLAHPKFYPDLAAKRLVYLSPKREEEAGGSMLRVLKMYQREFRIPLDSLGAIIARLAVAVDYTKFEDLKSEVEWARIITSLLREVDPLVDNEGIFHLPSLQEQHETD